MNDEKMDEETQKMHSHFEQLADMFLKESSPYIKYESRSDKMMPSRYNDDNNTEDAT